MRLLACFSWRALSRARFLFSASFFFFAASFLLAFCSLSFSSAISRRRSSKRGQLKAHWQVNRSLRSHVVLLPYSKVWHLFNVHFAGSLSLYLVCLKSEFDTGTSSTWLMGKGHGLAARYQLGIGGVAPAPGQATVGEAT